MSMGTVMPGIKIQAHRLQGLLDKQMIAKAGIFACLTIALLPLWLFMVSMALFPRIQSLLCLAVLTAVVMVCAAGALILFRIWIPPAAAVAGLSGGRRVVYGTIVAVGVIRGSLVDIQKK